MFRKLPLRISGLAVWIVVGLALAFILVACSSSTSPGPDSGDGPSEMTKPG